MTEQAMSHRKSGWSALNETPRHSSSQYHSAAAYTVYYTVLPSVQTMHRIKGKNLKVHCAWEPPTSFNCKKDRCDECRSSLHHSQTKWSASSGHLWRRMSFLSSTSPVHSRNTPESSCFLHINTTQHADIWMNLTGSVNTEKNNKGAPWSHLVTRGGQWKRVLWVMEYSPA